MAQIDLRTRLPCWHVNIRGDSYVFLTENVHCHGYKFIIYHHKARFILLDAAAGFNSRTLRKCFCFYVKSVHGVFVALFSFHTCLFCSWFCGQQRCIQVLLFLSFPEKTVFFLSPTTPPHRVSNMYKKERKHFNIHPPTMLK